MEVRAMAGGPSAMGVRARWADVGVRAIDRWESERDGVPGAMGGRTTGPERWGGERRSTMTKGALTEGVTAETCSITRQSLRLARGVG